MSGAAAHRHYRRPGLVGDILAALALAPSDAPLDPATLAALDHFHVGGAAATRRLAGHARLAPGEHVLDLGSGLGGPARLLAGVFGARVTGLDLSADFCAAAACLGRMTGLDGRVAIVCGDAVRLPFGDGVFDVVWTEHTAMNIAGRAALYAECARVLRPGGRLALYDIVRAGGGPDELRYPVPWARGPEASHLLTAAELRATLRAAGLAERVWIDESAGARDWLVAATQPRPGAAATPKATLRLVMGPDFPQMIANLRDNFVAGRTGAVQAVFAKA